jgi:hypothetical protein
MKMDVQFVLESLFSEASSWLQNEIAGGVPP